MPPITYNRQRGETITIALLDDGASSAAAPLVTAYARLWANGTQHIDPTATAVRFFPQYRAAAGAIGQGWTLSLDAGACAAMAARSYGLDLKIVDGQGAAFVIDPALLVISEPSTVLPTIAPATITYPDPTGVIVPFVGLRKIGWIADAPLNALSIAAIVGPPGAGSSGSAIGTPVLFTVVTGGQQIFAFTGTRAIAFLNSNLIPPANISFSGGNIIIAASTYFNPANGDVIVAYPI